MSNLFNEKNKNDDIDKMLGSHAAILNSPYCRMSKDMFYNNYSKNPMLLEKNRALHGTVLNEDSFFSPLRYCLDNITLRNITFSEKKQQYVGYKSEDFLNSVAKKYKNCPKGVKFARFLVIGINLLYNCPDYYLKKLDNYIGSLKGASKLSGFLLYPASCVLGAMIALTKGLTSLMFFAVNLPYGAKYAWSKPKFFHSIGRDINAKIALLKELVTPTKVSQTKEDTLESKSSSLLNLSSTERDLESSRSNEASLESNNSLKQHKEVNVSLDSAKSVENSLSDKVAVENITKASADDKQRLGDKFISGMKKGK